MEIRLKMIGGAGDGEHVHVDADRHYYRHAIVDRTMEISLPYSEPQPIETMSETYTIRRVHYHGICDVAFLAPEKWTDQEAVLFLIDSHKAPRR